MNEIPAPSNSQIGISGDVCTVHLYITSNDIKEDEKLYHLFKEEQLGLENKVTYLVKEYLGQEFRIRDFRIDAGSVGIFFIVEAAYTIISKYKNFVESINIFSKQVQNLIEGFVASHSSAPVSITSKWVPSNALNQVGSLSVRTQTWLVSLWNNLLGPEAGYSNIGLFVAQIAFTIVSGITTFRGFYLLLDNNLLAGLAALGVQSLIFWLPRRFHSQKHWKLAFDIFSFTFSIIVSIIFSYQAFVDILVPQQLRELKSTSEAFAEVQPMVNKALTGIDTAVSKTAEKVEEYEKLADRELHIGHTKPDRPSSPGIGPIYEEWQALKDVADAKLQTLKALQGEANVHRNQINELEGKPGDPPKKRSDLKYHVNAILTIAQNQQVIDVLTEINKGVATDIQNLQTPEINTGETASGSAAIKERFMDGLVTAKVALSDLFEKKNLDAFHAGALVALFIATILDLLILVSGIASSSQRVLRSKRRFVQILLSNKDLEIVRSAEKLGLRIPRNGGGVAVQLSRSQDIAAQALLEDGYLKLKKDTVAGGSNSQNEILIINNKHILPSFIEDSN